MTTIGRATVYGKIKVRSQTGDRVKISGTFDPSQNSAWTTSEHFAAAANVFRQNIVGLAGDRDERFIPCVFDDHPDLDGSYAPVSPRVDDARRLTSESGILSWSLTLVPVAGYSHPATEVSYIHTVRTNDHGIIESTTSAIVDVLPTENAAATILDTTSGIGSLGNIDVEDADAGDFRTVSLATNVAGLTVARYHSLPAEHYLGACRFEIQVGTEWVPLVGRQIPLGIGRAWRISNGILRAQLDSTNLGELTVSTFSDSGGANWDSTWNFERYRPASTLEYFGYRSPVSASNTTGIEPIILRNGPERVTILMPQASGQFETWTLRRGGLAVEISVGTRSYADQGVRLASAAAVTKIEEQDMYAGGSGTNPVGFYTANDARGKRAVVVVDSTATLDAVNGAIYHDPYLIPFTSMNHHWFAIGITPSSGVLGFAADFISVVASQQEVVAL